jgi:hypothetical protein
LAWRHTSATITECQRFVAHPKTKSGYVLRDDCTVTWTDHGAEHHVDLVFDAGQYPAGSTITLAVLGNSAMRPGDILWHSLWLIPGLAGLTGLGFSASTLTGVDGGQRLLVNHRSEHLVVYGVARPDQIAAGGARAMYRRLRPGG